ncbi:MAG TPA: hypothetical protein VH305_03485 [Gaiella sp.]
MSAPVTTRRDLRRISAALSRTARTSPFETAVVVGAIVYALLRLSPSSYALSLRLLGADVDPWLGTPQPIRSDEWALLTPLFEASVNNGYERINETSFYHETLLSVIGLPLHDWGLIFKPLVWGFLVVPPSFAYSIYWSGAAALMLIGWSVLLRILGFRQPTAALISLLIFFTPFVQTWWTNPGPQLAFFPWVVIACLTVRRLPLLVPVLAALVPVWLMSFFYPAGIFPLLYLGVALCMALGLEKPSMRRTLAVVVGGLIGAGITLMYFRPVLSAYSDSFYPGHRWVTGGDLPMWQALSQVLPGTTTEGHQPLIQANICEASAVTTWLPALALCVVDWSKVRGNYSHDPLLRRRLRSIAILMGAALVVTLWQLTSLLKPLTYVLGFGISVEQRTLFASGVLLVVAAGYAIEKLPLAVTAGRLGAFAGIVVGAWLLAGWRLQPHPLVLRDELLVLLPVAALLPLATVTGLREGMDWRASLVLVALLPTVAVWGLFNPVQRTTVMFRKPDTEVTRGLDTLAAEREDGAIAVDGFPGAMLNGIGYRSVTHSILTPSPELFRRYFPEIPEPRFQFLFNRYAFFGLTRASSPQLLYANAVLLPVARMSRYAATR